jgi:hypothetical protein
MTGATQNRSISTRDAELAYRCDRHSYSAIRRAEPPFSGHALWLALPLLTCDIRRSARDLWPDGDRPLAANAAFCRGHPLAFAGLLGKGYLCVGLRPPVVAAAGLPSRPAASGLSIASGELTCFLPVAG